MGYQKEQFFIITLTTLVNQIQSEQLPRLLINLNQCTALVANCDA